VDGGLRLEQVFDNVIACSRVTASRRWPGPSPRS